MSYYGYGWKPYVSVAARRAKAERELKKLRKKGHPIAPVVITGRTIARTFWGKSWCDNLEHYSDFENRLPRGRTYVRNGSVVDLQIAPGEVNALVSGSEIYRVAVTVSAVPKARWRSICSDCAGAIDSLVELLQGRFSKGVMERICQQNSGLFPAPAEIQFSCSCPDWASMCKHVAAVLYGIGARLDERPELLFTLRKVDEKDLIAKAGKGIPLSKKGPADNKILPASGLSELFGLELGGSVDGSLPGRRSLPTATKAKSTGQRGRRKTVPVTEEVAAPAQRVRTRRRVAAAPEIEKVATPAKSVGRRSLPTATKAKSTGQRGRRKTVPVTEEVAAPAQRVRTRRRVVAAPVVEKVATPEKSHGRRSSPPATKAKSTGQRRRTKTVPVTEEVAAPAKRVRSRRRVAAAPEIEKVATPAKSVGRRSSPPATKNKGTKAKVRRNDRRQRRSGK